jgi:hypothetical protein
MDWGVFVGGILSGTIVGSFLTWLVATRSLALRRRIETTSTFLSIAATAHGRRVDSDGGVGVGEQIAAMWLLADLGNRDKWLRKAAVGFLDDELTWLGTSGHAASQRLLDAATEARGSLNT